MFHVKHSTRNWKMKRNIFSFCNQKGGVGKTTSVINIGAHLSSKGYKVLIIDTDSQGNLTSGIGMERPATESTAYQLFVDNTDPASLIQKTSYTDLEIIPSNANLAGAELELVPKIGREYCLKNQLRKINEIYDLVSDWNIF